MPTPQDLKPVADSERSHYEKTAMLSRQDAEALGRFPLPRWASRR